MTPPRRLEPPAYRKRVEQPSATTETFLERRKQERAKYRPS